MMKVRYIGSENSALVQGQIYDVMSIEKGWYRIMSEFYEDDYLFYPSCFEVIEEAQGEREKLIVE